MKLRREAEEDGRTIEVIPSKVVFTRKPGPRGGKPKVRWVVCGNFETKKPEEDNFSSGADATAFRVMCHYAVQHQWRGSIIDVKTAFLNAEWKEGQETTIVVKPPGILVEMGSIPKGSYFVPRRAVYGFRRSPKLWGEHRDQMLETLEVEVEGGVGGPLILVDDMFIVGRDEVVGAVMKKLRACWKTSEPEEVGR